MRVDHTYFEFAAFILTQLPDEGPNDNHNSFSDVIACKGTFELTLLAKQGENRLTKHLNISKGHF